MPNRPRPRCPKCGAAMEPLYRKRVRGETYARVGDLFWCQTCDRGARGRRKPAFF